MNKWKHKDHKGSWVSSYEKDRDGERLFVLTQKVEKLDGGFRKITFESWQMAKLIGWEKC